MQTKTDIINAPELNEDSHIGWCGFIIRRKMDFGSNPQIGYVVVKDGCNPMPGATWFKSVSDAKKGIAAYKIALHIAPKKCDGYVTCDGDIFWMLMELTK